VRPRRSSRRLLISRQQARPRRPRRRAAAAERAGPTTRSSIPTSLASTFSRYIVGELRYGRAERTSRQKLVLTSTPAARRSPPLACLLRRTPPWPRGAFALPPSRRLLIIKLIPSSFARVLQHRRQGASLAPSRALPAARLTARALASDAPRRPPARSRSSNQQTSCSRSAREPVT
jgi:hypothetical protein